MAVVVVLEHTVAPILAGHPEKLAVLVQSA
jgi:hypothetical protein